MQRGELASPPGRNAVELFRGALELDPSNTLAKAGLIRVADRLLTAAERAITAGSVEDARKMVAVAESLTPATARGAFLMMQIEREHERAALTRAKDNDAQDKLAKGATYLRLANARLRSGALIEPSEDNARYYLEAARQIMPDDPGVEETSRLLQKQLLDRAAAAATAGNAAETERWLANADSAGAPRQEMTTIRRSLQDTLIGARAGRMTTLTQSFTAALAANRLVQPANDNAKFHLLALINTDGGSPAVASARQSLGSAYINESRSAVTRNDLAAADTWLNEARTIGFTRRVSDHRGHRARDGARKSRAAQRPHRCEFAGAHRVRGSEIPVRHAQPRHVRLGGTGVHRAHRWLHRRHRGDQFQPAQDFRQCRHDGGGPVALQARPRTRRQAHRAARRGSHQVLRANRWTPPAHNVS